MNFQIKDECIYWHLIGMVTDTIASRDYLDHYYLMRTEIKCQVDSETNMISLNNDWEVFQEDFNKLASNKKKLLKKYPPGLYVQNFGDNIGVHFYGLNDEGIMANGYPDNEDFENGIGLGFQKDHSHGFCQTYAIMHIIGADGGFESRMEEDTDKDEVYSENGQKALLYLLELTDDPWKWSDIDTFESELPVIENCKYDKTEMNNLLSMLSGVRGDKSIYLNDIVQVLINNPNHFENWFK
jgi:hypothetical protein